MNTTTALEPAQVLATSETAAQSSTGTAAESLAEVVPAANTKPRKPRLWTVFAGLLLVVVVSQLAVVAAMFVLGAGTGIVMGAHGASGAEIQARIAELSQRPLLGLLISLIPLQLGMIFGLRIVLRRSQEPIKQRLGLVPQTGRVFGAFRLARMAAFTFSASLVCLIFAHVLIPAPAAKNQVGTVIDDGSWLAVSVLSILLSVIPALVEETVFRGYLQRRLLKRWSPVFAIGVTMLLFASLHFDSPHHMIAVLPLGMVTGLLAYRTNSIKPGMVVHGIHNATVVGYGAFGRLLAPHVSGDTMAIVALGMIAVLGLIGLPTVISLLRRPKSRPTVETPTASVIGIETVSTPSRELDRPAKGVDSVLASTAV